MVSFYISTFLKDQDECSGRIDFKQQPVEDYLRGVLGTVPGEVIYGEWGLAPKQMKALESILDGTPDYERYDFFLSQEA
jgi:hypothetical protein